MSEDEFPTEIAVLTGAQVVRRRPQMYFDANSPDLATTLIMQSLCHAIDDAIAGCCSAIFLSVAGNQVEVNYNSGMPLDPDIEYPNWTVAQIFLTIHLACHSRKRHLNVGSKFCQIGIAVLNAVCGELTAEIMQSGKHGVFRFARGELIESPPLQSTTLSDGTRLRFALDSDMVPNAIPRETDLQDAIEAIRAELPKLAISLEYRSA